MTLELKPNKSKSRINKMTASSSRKRPQRLLLLLLALGAAVLSVVLLHKLREGRVSGLLLQDCDSQLHTLQLLLKRERENSKEMKRKLEDMRAKTFILRTQKMELSDKLTEAQATADHLQKIKKEMETVLEEKQNQINGLMEKAEESITANLQVAALTKLLKQDEAEVEEMKHQLMKLSPPENITTLQDELIENSTNSIEEREASNANEVKGKQQEEIPREGQWVKFQTNEDDHELNVEGRGVSEDHLMEKPKDSQENENSGEEGEIGQVRKLEVKEQSEELKNGEGNLNGMKGKEQADTKDEELDKPKNSQYGNDQQQVAPKDQNLATEGEEPKMRVGHRNKTKTKGRRRRSVPKGREVEKHDDEHSKHNDGHSEKSQNNENLRVGDENADNSTTEGNKYGSGEKNKLEDEQKETVSSTSKLESPKGSQVDEGSKIESQSNFKGMTEAREERPVSTDSQLENSQEQEGNNLNGTAREGEGKEVTPKERQSEKSDNPQDDKAENKSNDDKAGVADDLIKDKGSDAERQDGVIKEAVDVNTTANPEQTEAQNTVDDHQSQVPENTTNIADDSSVGEFKGEEDREIKKNAGDNNSDNMAEFKG